MPTAKALILVATVLTIVAGCRRQPEPALEPVAGGRLENPELGLALASVPAPFEAVAAEGSAWTFTAPGPGGTGTLVVTAGPEAKGSINLVDEVKARKEWFESVEGATYYGNRELGGPFGTIYTARGSYGPPEAPVEETWAYAIHPGAYRLLTVQYTYPVQESGTRVEQLLELLGEIEALGEGGES